MIKIIMNNVGNYPELLEFDNEDDLVSWLSCYYERDRAKEIAEEILSNGECYLRDGDSTFFEVV